MLRLLLLSLPLFSCATSFRPDLSGDWSGQLITPGGDLPIVFHISREGKRYEATMDSPDQGEQAFGIPVDTVEVKGNDVTIRVSAIGGIYTARYVKQDDLLDGRWEQNHFNFELDLRRNQLAESRKRPQEPKPPFPYASRDVTFVNDVDKDTLAGTLTYPNGDGPWPAVILISGSGPQDRNEQIAGHKPFLVISDHFTRNGYAVLRYDDRGFGQSTGDFANADSRDFARDVVAAVKFMRAQPEIDPKRIGLLGHSEGGIIAPMVAYADTNIAFIILMAGPAVSGEHILYQQNEAIYRMMGIGDSAIAFNQRAQQKFYKVILDSDTGDCVERLMEVAYNVLDSAPKDISKELNYSEKAFEAGLPQLCDPWWRFFIRYDPGPQLRFVDCPILALFGGRDLQVPVDPNAFMMELYIARDGGKNEVKVFPDVNHLFQRAKTGAIDEYGRLEETISPEVLEYMTEWLAP